MPFLFWNRSQLQCVYVWEFMKEWSGREMMNWLVELMVFRSCLVAEKVLGRKLRFEITEWLAGEFRVSSSLLFSSMPFCFEIGVNYCVCAYVWEFMKEWSGREMMNWSVELMVFRLCLIAKKVMEKKNEMWNFGLAS